jgi:hypothetical protein
MELWERVIETRLRREAQVSVNQFGFMSGRSTTEAMHILRRLIEKFKEKKRDLHMVFIDLEKAYDSVPHGVMLSREHRCPLEIYGINQGHVWGSYDKRQGAGWGY